MNENYGYHERYAYEKRQKDAKTVRIIVTVTIAVIIAAASFFIGFFSRGCVQNDKLASLEWMLSVIDENYFYSDEFDDDGARVSSLKAIASHLDMYSEYYTAEEYAALVQSNSGAKSGIGITYNFLENKGAYIVTVVENSPASKHLRAGDLVVSGAASGNTVYFRTSADFANFMDARTTGEKFTLSTEEKSFEISKEAYTASYAFMATNDTAWECVAYGGGKQPSLVENPLRKIEYLPEGSAYIALTQFYGGMADEFGALMTKFNAENCTTMYLDLRNNGGGYVSVMQDVAGYFTSSVSSKTNVAMTAKYKNGKTEVYNCAKHSGNSLVPEDTKIYVLANSGTASASEALIGVLYSYGFIDYKDIFISDFSDEYLSFAGANAKTGQTYGKGIMQSTFVNRKTGEALKLTVAQIYWPDGNCIHNVALSEKDGCTLIDADWTATKGDTELQRVVQMTN